jgi:hypothetical protein
MFENTTLGVNADINMINHASRVQVYLGALDKFYVAVPASVRNGGVRGLKSANTLAEALTIAESLVEKYTAKMNRLHATALKMNAAR